MFDSKYKFNVRRKTSRRTNTINNLFVYFKECKYRYIEFGTPAVDTRVFSNDDFNPRPGVDDCRAAKLDYDTPAVLVRSMYRHSGNWGN